MAELKTKPTRVSVKSFLEKIPDEHRRKDCRTLVTILKQATRSEPKMWGPSIVGFGDYRCRYPSGRELDWFHAGFSPRKQALTLYLTGGFAGREKLLTKLGKFKTGGGCLYVKQLADVDLAVLKELVRASVAETKRRQA
jgi:hypothetical protein